ncbi:MAG: hypothetical protein AAF685_05825 [Cyanobacteria bacterium P01_C01_bin.89]
MIRISFNLKQRQFFPVGTGPPIAKVLLPSPYNPAVMHHEVPWIIRPRDNQDNGTFGNIYAILDIYLTDSPYRAIIEAGNNV